MDAVKKKRRIFFYSDRILKCYENGFLAYFLEKSNEVKCIINPKDIQVALLKEKDKIHLVTKSKSYVFKFASHENALEWLNLISKATHSSK